MTVRRRPTSDATKRPLTTRSVAEVERECEFRAVVASVQVHGPAGPPEAPGPTRDGEGAVLGVVERTFDDDLAALHEGRPVALVRRGGHDADAVALIGSDAVGVGAVEDLVCEGKNVAGAVALRTGVGGRVRRGVLDDGEGFGAAPGTVRTAGQCRDRVAEHAERDDGEDDPEQALHGHPFLGTVVPHSGRYRRID